jgi:hypothetical protein
LIDLGANEKDNLAAGKLNLRVMKNHIPYIVNKPEHFITRTFDGIRRGVVLKPWPDGIF